MGFFLSRKVRVHFSLGTAFDPYNGRMGARSAMQIAGYGSANELPSNYYELLNESAATGGIETEQTRGNLDTSQRKLKK